MDLDAKPADAPVPPLVVDLDGTLIQTDLLLKSLFSYLGAYPFRMLSLASALSHGKAPFKAEIARYAAIEPAQLPYDERVLSLIRQARGNGRQVFLASASNEQFVRDVAGHLGLFTGWFASTDGENYRPRPERSDWSKSLAKRALTTSAMTGRIFPFGLRLIDALRLGLRHRSGAH